MKPMKPRPLGGPHDALAALMEEIAIGEGQPADAGPRLAAEFLAVGRSTLYKQLDPDQPEVEMSFVRVAQLTGRFGVRSAAHYLARLIGCVLVGYRPDAHAETPLNALAHTVKETSEAVGAIADWAQHPAETTQGKRRATIREIDQAIEALLEVRARIVHPDGEGGQ